MPWIVLLGVVTGMRTMTAMAVVCWAAHAGWLPLGGTWAFWMGNLVTCVVFTLAAVGEYIGDTLPMTPSRAALGPAVARFAFGMVVGAAAATALGEPLAGGILAGALGAAIGTFGGVRWRLHLARLVGHDLPVALAESAAALLLAVLSAHKLQDAVVSLSTHGLLLTHALCLNT